MTAHDDLRRVRRIGEQDELNVLLEKATAEANAAARTLTPMAREHDARRTERPRAGRAHISFSRRHRSHTMTASKQYPKMLMIIRHAEKPGNASSDKNGGKHLSIRGSARAAALPSLFTPDPTATPVRAGQLGCDLKTGSSDGFTGAYEVTPVQSGASRFLTPDFLFATEKTSSSNRPVETITPVSRAIGVKINESYTNDSKGIADLKKAIMENPGTYAGKVILICWHHGKIPHLAKAFGVSKSQLGNLDPWPGTVFDILLQITWSGEQVNLAVQHQKLLFGDSVGSATAGMEAV
jgi:hypothetical protein